MALINNLKYATITNRILFRKFSSAMPQQSLLSSCIQTSEKNGVRDIILNHPKTRNSLSMEMMSALLNDITKNNNDPNLRCIVLSGNGPVFSAGHNLKELTAEKGVDYHKLVFARCSELMLAIINSPVPVIAKVNGLAAAAGCQLVATCDIVICTDKSSFSTPGANFGIFCSTPGIAVARSVAPKTATFMLMTGLPLQAQDALRAGLVSKVVPEDQLENEVSLICESIKTKSRSVIQLGKKFYYEQLKLDVQVAYNKGSEVMVNNINLKDGQEGIKSFAEKRKPIWSHSFEK